MAGVAQEVFGSDKVMAHPDPGSLEVDSNSLMQTAQRLN